MERGVVQAVSRSADHGFPKWPAPQITLVAGQGIAGDSHSEVQEQESIRQVHFMASELLQEISNAGIQVEAGTLGENVATSGVDVMGLPLGTKLRVGSTAQVTITGMRTPCRSLEAQYPGVTRQMLSRTDDGELVRKTGVFGVVDVGGDVAPGDGIMVDLPPEPHQPLPVL